MAEQSSVATGSPSQDHSSVTAAIKGLAMTDQPPASPGRSDSRMPQTKPFVVAPRSRERATSRTDTAAVAAPRMEPARAAETARADKPGTEAPRPASEKSSEARTAVLKAASPDLSKVSKVLKVDSSKLDVTRMKVPDIAGKLLHALPGSSWFTRSRPAQQASETSEPLRSDPPVPGAARPEMPPLVTAAARIRPQGRSLLATTAMLAILAGGTAGVLATAAIWKYYGADSGMLAANSDLQDTVTRIESEVQSLKTTAEQAAQTEQAVGQASERLDRLERAQAEAAAKLQRLGEGPERVRSSPASAMAAVPPPAPPPVREIASRPPVVAASPPPRPAQRATEPASRLPVLEGWTLRDVTRGVALIEGRRGFYEVLAGDPIPGLGRVDAIRRQDGRWVVVTSKGLVVAR